MDDEFPDYADLIAQYEATEIDMLSNLDRTNGNSTINSNTNSNTNERLRANAPDAEDDDNIDDSESDSEEYSQTSYTENDDDDDSQTSYTEATGNQNDEDIGGEEDDSQTSYIDDDDDDDDPEALEDYFETKDQLEDYDSDTSGGDYHSKDSFEGGMNLEEADDDDDDDDYESVGGDDADDDNGSHTSYTDDGNDDDDDDDDDSHTSYTDDGKKPDPIAPVASVGSSDGEAPPTPRKKDNSDGSLDLEDLHSESSYEEDSGSDNDDDENPQQLHQDDHASYNSHGSSYTGSSFASEDHDEHLEDDDDSHTSYEEDVEFESRTPDNDEDRPKSHNSMESYETAESESDDESDDDEEPVDNIISKSTRDDGSMSFYSSNDDVSSNDDDGSNQEDGSYQSGSGSEESESENDNENDSYSDESDDDDDDDKSSNDDENDSYNSEESEEAEVLDAGDYDPSESPTFNKRGDSKHSFKHPSVASGLSDNDSNQSGWEDSEGMSYTESPSNNHDDGPFEDEPKSKRKGRKTPKLPPFDDAESDDDDNDNDNESSSDRQSEFQDEYPSNKDVKRGSFVNGNESNVEEYSTAYEGESTRSGSKMKKDVRKTSQSSMSSVDLSHIMTREKLVVDRENTVNTRERKFTRWFILASVLVLIGAIVLVTLYFVKPKKEETSPPVSFPTFAVPVISPEPTTGPTNPIIPTAEPTPLPPNKIVVETSFLAFVPDGKTNGVTTEALEEQLVDVMGVLLPPLLMDTLIFDDIFAARTRYRLRKLLPSNRDDITVGDSPSVDVVEVDCPAGSPESYLCVQVTTNVPIINSSNDFTEEFASDLKTAYSTAITGAVDKGIFSDLGSDVGLVSYVDPTKVDTATQQPTIKPTEAPKETPTEAPVAINATSVAPSFDGTQTLTQLRGSIEPTITSNFTDSNSTDSNSTDNNSTDSNSTDSNSTDNNSTDSNSTDVSSVPTDSPANTNVTVSPTESVPATELPTPIPTSKEPTQGPSSPIKETAPPTGESIDDDETCKDKNEGCQDVSESGECERTKCALWASENECSTNPEYMTVNCQKSCGLCGDTPNPPKPACSDKNDRCVEWALQNECVNNPTYMELNCRDACGFCDCQDKNDECSQQSSTNNGCLQTKCALWASQNECESNADYMGIYCRKSCDQCVASDNACIDDDDRCSGWASEGECTINPAFMQQRCAKSCGVC